MDPWAFPTLGLLWTKLCCGLSVIVPLRVHMVKSNLQCAGVWRWTLRRWWAPCSRVDSTRGEPRGGLSQSRTWPQPAASRAEKRKRSMVMTPHNPFPIFGSFLKQPELARTSCYEDLSGVFLWTSFLVFLGKKPKRVRPWWHSGWESACQRREPGSILLWEYSTGHGAAKSMHHNCWAWSHNYCNQCA